jgi:hypothetical protein
LCLAEFKCRKQSKIWFNWISSDWIFHQMPVYLLIWYREICCHWLVDPPSNWINQNSKHEENSNLVIIQSLCNLTNYMMIILVLHQCVLVCIDIPTWTYK